MTERRRVQKDCSTGGRTLQSHAAACDVNVMMEKYQKQGMPLTHICQVAARYGDFSEAISFMDAFQLVREAELEFMTLPAKVRARCNHDPAEFLRFVHDPANREELEEMGLVEVVPKAEGPGEEPPVSEPQAAGEGSESPAEGS